ncbi:MULTISPECIES: phosphate ABC transporter substrate-binding protein PstS [unclassified Azospirillum]|uniref:phosphate ABC transporter substrate-binding protein PstS n=1 Tax=unclassified Azospirillum TaxID=2630922 RepID=UPI000B679BA4|nr:MULTISPECIES: phosphate ABC transporter substrate-binding protein PstS [unclassified Azospirillum]SNR86111.1 phosphate ABC transporter substrate-binding protein, PhoT family [Azospirillum sp. RU38E]SNS02179.1 phosphate ABC transporter substrate-binding protein, PhoT family [Azospirillum sp. RU37A]
MGIMSRFLAAPVLAALVGFGIAGVAPAADISGAGATFPYPVYAKWADSYKKETGTGLNYQSIGSGGGIKQIKAKTVTFGASDAPLKEEELKQDALVQWPMIMGGAVPAINVPGLNPGELTLDGPTLARIYLGEITKWNDPAIAALNKGVKLPNTAIAVVYRSDGSGTNFLFTNYLSKVSKDFEGKVGAAASVQWPTGIGAKGNEGVANMVKQTAGAIGYVEYAYVKQNHMNYAGLINPAGKKVQPEAKSFQAAAANADWAHTPGYAVILTNQPGAESWPITGASFILMHEKVEDPAAAAEALKFFDWAYKKGGKEAEALDYVPMPASVADMVRKTWAEHIKDANGKPVHAG